MREARAVWKTARAESTNWSQCTVTVADGNCATERWAPAPGFEGHYLVSDDGRIRSLKRRNGDGSPLYVNWKTDTYGYAAVDLWRDGRPRRRRVHVLVAAAFLGAPPVGEEVRHLDGDRMNPRLANLAYGTRAENVADCLNHGTNHQKRKTHCPQGHAYSEENTYSIPSRPNARYCRACNEARKRRP